MHFPQSQNTMAPPLHRSAFSAKHVSLRHRSFSFWQLTSHFLLALVSQFHVLHFFAFLLLLDFVSLLLFVLVLAQSFSSQFLNLLAFLLLLSLESLYLSLLPPLLLLLSVFLLFFSQHFLRLLSPFPELKPLLVPLLFYEPLFFSCALLSFSCLRASSCAFAISIYLRSEASLSIFNCSICNAICCFCISNSSLRNLSALSLASFSSSLRFPLSLLVPSSLHAFVFLHLVFVSLHPVSSSFASYFPFSSF